MMEANAKIIKYNGVEWPLKQFINITYEIESHLAPDASDQAKKRVTDRFDAIKKHMDQHGLEFEGQSQVTTTKEEPKAKALPKKSSAVKAE